MRKLKPEIHNAVMCDQRSYEFIAQEFGMKVEDVAAVKTGAIEAATPRTRKAKAEDVAADASADDANDTDDAGEGGEAAPE